MRPPAARAAADYAFGRPAIPCAAASRVERGDGAGREVAGDLPVTRRRPRGGRGSAEGYAAQALPRDERSRGATHPTGGRDAAFDPLLDVCRTAAAGPPPLLRERVVGAAEKAPFKPVADRQPRRAVLVRVGRRTIKAEGGPWNLRSISSGGRSRAFSALCSVTSSSPRIVALNARRHSGDVRSANCRRTPPFKTVVRGNRTSRRHSNRDLSRAQRRPLLVCRLSLTDLRNR